jgi:hypothetical protein
MWENILLHVIPGFNGENFLLVLKLKAEASAVIFFIVLSLN